MSHSLSRRQFLQAASTVGTATIVSATALGTVARAAPSARITVGVVGLGARGFNLLDAMLDEPDVQVVALCDVDQLHHRDRPWGTGTAYGREPAKQRVDSHYAKAAKSRAKSDVEVHSDFRQLCAREDVDVVVVATPDHWHALVTLEALRAGKDVYCEKPVTHTFSEGQLVYQEVARREAVFQVGSQQRSGPDFRRAAELVRDGRIGQLRRVEVGLPPGYAKPMGEAISKSPPKQLDYNFWTGPAPLMAYMRARNHRWWRGHRAYGGGVLMDFIGHHNDIAHWGMGMDQNGPTNVEAVGWKLPETDIYDTPRDYDIRCAYAGGITTSISNRNPLGTKFIGEEGWIYVNRSGLTASDPRFVAKEVERKTKYSYPYHIRNFLDCVKSRETCIAPAETGHRSITPGHLGYVSHELGRAIQWDPAAERVINDEEADKRLKTTTYRKPWQLA